MNSRPLYPSAGPKARTTLALVVPGPGAGLTNVLILRESHAVLHAWPETGTVDIDIFSCPARLKSLEAVKELSRSLGARPVSVSVQEIPRADGHCPGLPSPARA